MPGAPRIKFCGITRLDDAHAAVEAGAWALGVILWPGSRRACDPVEAEAITRTLKRRVLVAGVFVNAPLDEVALTVDALGLTMVQLHGDEGPSFCAEVARRTGVKVIKAGRVAAQSDIQALEPFRTDFHLLDAHRPGLLGGTGETFDWRLVSARRTHVPLVLSGGLTEENVGDAIAATAPFAVDVASGTEAAPGIKDHAKLAAFAAAVHASAPDPSSDDERDAEAAVETGPEVPVP